MSSFYGKKITVDIVGASHAPEMCVRVHGMPAMTIDKQNLFAFLDRRRAKGGVYATARQESDLPRFEGLDGDRIVGDFAAYIANANVHGADYADLYGRPRPAHADYAWHCKEGTLDFAGGGRFSGRMTAPLCVVGGIALQYLQARGVRVCAYISRIGDVAGISYKDEGFVPPTDESLSALPIPAPKNADAMLQAVARARAEGDSVGGRIECVVSGLPAGLGDNLFEGLEGKLATLLYAVPAVKGVEFGAGFDLCAMRGSEANDALYYDDGGVVRLRTNHMGGINGGISNGALLTMGVAVKPTPSIAKAQQTVDLVTHSNVTINIGGRHDACILPRAVPVIEAVVALALLDEWPAE